MLLRDLTQASRLSRNRSRLNLEIREEMNNYHSGAGRSGEFGLSRSPWDQINLNKNMAEFNNYFYSCCPPLN